jgi:Glycosyl transferase family 2
MAMSPRFSIGITTYNRLEMLRECVTSLLRQAEEDFEILIGNDYQPLALTRDLLGIDDPRIRIINHPSNLGERRNINALLEAASGRYFTWHADDDFYAPTYLASMRDAFDRFPEADAAFCSFTVVEDSSILRYGTTPTVVDPEGLSGAEFLRGYWRGKFETMGFTCMYRRELLRSLGGLVALCDAPIAAMSEYFLILQAGMFAQVVYIPSPLVYFRVHDASWSMTTTDILAWESAATNFVVRGLRVLRDRAYGPDYALHLKGLLHRAFSSVLTVVFRPASQPVLHRELSFFLRCIYHVIRGTEGHRVEMICVVLIITARYAVFVCVESIRRTWARARGAPKATSAAHEPPAQPP